MTLIIVNPNPIFDRTITVAELVPGAVMRTLDVELTAGGKGINVARVLRALETPARLVIPTGREDRAKYESLLEDEGAVAELVEVAGPIRMASIYREMVSSRVTVVNDAGHPMSIEDWQSIHRAIVDTVTAGDIVAVMGSFPPGLDPQALVELTEALHDKGVKILLDVNPVWLAASLVAKPDVVTPNVDEAEAALSETTAGVMDAHTQDDSLMRERAERAARELCRRGAIRAFVTAGSAGVAMAGEGSETWVAAFPVTAVSTVGAGDSFVAGLLHEWGHLANSAEVDWPTAMRFGVATSSSSCERVRAGGIDPQRVQEIMNSLREVSLP